MQLIVLAFALLAVACGQQELVAIDLFDAIVALNVSDLSDALVAQNFSAIDMVSDNSTTLVISYEPVDQPPIDFPAWATALFALVCQGANETFNGSIVDCSSQISQEILTPVNTTKRDLTAYIYTLTISGAAVLPVPSPTPSPGTTPTPTPLTPTPTLTPTPGVTPTPPTPTPTPQTPTPTPPVIPSTGCPNDCVVQFRDKVNTWVRNTSFTIQCKAWSDLFDCITQCDNSDVDLLQKQADCVATTYISDVCDCGSGKPAFDGVILAEILRDFNDVVVDNFKQILGVVSAEWSTQRQNAILVNFVWEDSTEHNPVDSTKVTVGEILSAVPGQLGDFLNQDATNFIVKEGDDLQTSTKRTQQSTSFTANLVQTGPSGGVSTLSVSFAFVLVAFLLNVLF